MKNSNKFRIVIQRYRDEYGVVQNYHYIVQELRPVLFFWNGWFPITHRDCGYGDCYDTTTEFKTQVDAELFIKEILCPNVKKDSWSSEVIGEYECNKTK